MWKEIHNLWDPPEVYQRNKTDKTIFELICQYLPLDVLIIPSKHTNTKQ